LSNGLIYKPERTTKLTRNSNKDSL